MLIPNIQSIIMATSLVSMMNFNEKLLDEDLEKLYGGNYDIDLDTRRYK